MACGIFCFWLKLFLSIVAFQCCVSFCHTTKWICMKCEVLVAQPSPTLCDPMDCSPPGSSLRGILQARILEWVAIVFSRQFSLPRDETQVSRIAGKILFCLSQQGSPESATRAQISPLVWVSFPFRPQQSIEQNSLCYTVSSHELPILYIIWTVYIQHLV